jgi:hypothetical protein
MSDAELQMGVSIVDSVVKEKLSDDMSVEEKAKACFETALDDNNTWFTLDENTLFIIGVATLMLNVEEEDKLRIKAEFDVLKGLGVAASMGVPVDIGALMKGLEDIEVIGLQKIWKPLWHASKKKG